MIRSFCYIPLCIQRIRDMGRVHTIKHKIELYFLSRLKPALRRSEKAGLEGRKEVCIFADETCYCEHNACRHARLGRVQTG